MKTFLHVTAVVLMSLLPYLSHAVEVKNLKVSQEGDNAVATFDLVATAGEKVAEVTVAINIDGKKRTDQLHLNGDFGKNVKVGKGKRIIWNAMNDLPPGFDGELSWDVRVAKKDNGTADGQETAAGGNTDEYQRITPRPELPFALSEEVWKAIENSEGYRKLPRPRSIRVAYQSEMHTEYTGSQSRTLPTPAPTQMLHNMEVTPLGNKCVSTKLNMDYSSGHTTAVSYTCGNIALGSMADGKTNGYVGRIDELNGSLFPMRIGAKQSLRYYYVYLPDRSYDNNISSVCQVTDRGEARTLNPKLTGVAWRVHCQSSSTFNQGTSNASESDNYFLEDLGIFLDSIGQYNLTTKKFELPEAGSMGGVIEAPGEYGSRMTTVYKSYDWTVGE